MSSRKFLSRDPLAIVRYHRGITHSFLALPFFAAILAWLTRAGFALLKKKFKSLRDIESPSWPILFVIYAIAIASHIILDAMTSFGTRIWDPLSQERVAWDLLFIIDFSFTAIALLPQVVAWIYADRAKAPVRAISMWMLIHRRRIRRLENRRSRRISFPSLDRVFLQRYHRRALFSSGNP